MYLDMLGVDNADGIAIFSFPVSILSVCRAQRNFLSEIPLPTGPVVIGHRAFFCGLWGGA